VVSYQFDVFSYFDLENNSNVDFEYRLHIPGNKEDTDEQEFWISPI
jgi:hypothetical protein